MSGVVLSRALLSRDSRVALSGVELFRVMMS